MLRDLGLPVALRDRQFFRRLACAAHSPVSTMRAESPVVHTPQRGKAITIKYLTAAVATLRNPSSEFVGEWSGDKSVVVEFKSEIEGITINGIDMINIDESGLITHFKVMIRPLKAVNLLHRKMGEMLAAFQ
jgi:hypothetical protein